ncbi:MAG: TetR/AcrR family transcriptional regulator [Rhodocyclaceae bacterium]|nr:TetR/AcrR family transcriptional regulator [Rhodocyclaceae bacterium]
MTTSKGERTRSTILDAAVALACVQGFEALSIGSLADRVGMSKSGLFGHFGSREELQIAAIEAAAERFAVLVYRPALEAPRGLARLNALIDNWLTWVERCGWDGGCPLEGAIHEFDDRPGPVKAAVVRHFSRLERELARTIRLCVDTGEFDRDLDVDLFVFRLMGVVMAFHYRRRLMGGTRAEAVTRGAFAMLIKESAPGRVRLDQ